MAGKKPRVKTSDEVVPYINVDRPVFVYRNLNFKCLSVMQDGIVRCHVDNIVLEDCEFRVGKAGQAKVRETQSKNVHAKVKGYLVPNPQDILDMEWDILYYNPYTCDEFIHQATGTHVKAAKFVDIDTVEGILSFGTEFMSKGQW